MSASMILYEHHDSSAVITLNCPERLNELSSGMLRSLAETFDKIESGPTLRSVILTGAGAEAFCVDAYIDKMGEYTSNCCG